MVRERSAKPLFTGSNPVAASKWNERVRLFGLALFCFLVAEVYAGESTLPSFLHHTVSYAAQLELSPVG